MTARTSEDALWLGVLASFERQSPDLRQRLDDFKTVARPGVRKALLCAGADLNLAELEGGLSTALDGARTALALASDGDEPLAHTGVLSLYSYLLRMVGRYHESLLSAQRLVAIAEGCGIDFPLRYAQINRAAAYIGLRRFALADRALSMLERDTQDEPRTYFHANLPVQRARLYASLGDPQRGLDALSLGPSEQSSHAALTDFAGWETLLSAIVGDSDDVGGAAAASSMGRSIEATSLFCLAQAIVGIRCGDLSQADSYMDEAIETEAWDPVVIAVRAEPTIAQRLAERRKTRTWLKRLLAQSADVSLADSLGIGIPRPAKQKQKLTPRETEVHELVAQGLTNEEIAKLLYISLSTTKVHVKHIYDKLGVRSRLEAARALREDI